MKKSGPLFLAFVLLMQLSCKKQDKTNTTTNEPTATPISVPADTPNDFRDKYLGFYNCHVKWNWYVNSTYMIIDSTYSVVMEVRKGDAAGSLKMTGPSGNKLVLDVVFDTEPNFSGARIHGYFFKSDSLYINNSHPAGLYSYIYSGKRVAM